MGEEKSRKEKTPKNSREGMRRTSNANYMAIMTALAVAFVVVINLIVNALGSNFTQIDLSRQDIFTLTDVSIEYLKNLEEDITIITLAEPGQEYADLERLLQDYEAHSSHIKLEKRDPAKSPDIVSKYNANLTQGSIVVVCGEKYRAIDLTDMLIQSTIDSNSSYVYYQYDMEGLITNAIEYVTSDVDIKAYVLTGSGKSSLGVIETDIEKQGIRVDEVNLEDEGRVPEDADLLILHMLVKDFTDKEYEYLTEYLNNGGTMFISEEALSIKTGTVLPNYDALLERYGMSVEHVTVLEQNSSYYYTGDTSYNFMVKPVLRSHEITDDFKKAGTELLMVTPDKIDISEKENVEIIPLLESSGTAYYKSKEDGSLAKLNTDPSGTFTYMAAAVETMENGTQSKMIYSSSYSLLSREYVESKVNDTLAAANTKFVISCMKWLTGQEDTIYVDKKSKSYNRLVYMHDVDVKLGYLTLGVPAAVLLTGGIVWYRRRKK